MPTRTKIRQTQGVEALRTFDERQVGAPGIAHVARPLSSWTTSSFLLVKADGPAVRLKQLFVYLAPLLLSIASRAEISPSQHQ